MKEEVLVDAAASRVFRFAVGTALFAVLAGLAQTACAEICTWTGGKGDGKWSSAENWDVPPVTGRGDSLVFNGGAFVTENDTEDFSVAGIRCLGSGTKTFNGRKVVLTGRPFIGLNNNGAPNQAYTLSNACTVVYNVELRFSANAHILLDPPCDGAYFNGNIEIDSGKTLTVGDAFAYMRGNSHSRPYYFNGSIDAPEATVTWSAWGHSTVYINGSVDVKNFNFNYSGSPMYLPDFAGGLRVRSGTLAPWYVKMHFRNGDVFGEYLPILDMGTSYYETGDVGTIFLNGKTVTVDRLGAGSKAKDKTDTTGHSIASGYSGSATASSATLVMKATGDTSTYLLIRGNTSLVWDPVGAPRTIEFKQRNSTTEGALTVSNGTFRITDGATFPNLQEIHLADNAVFDMASTNVTRRPLNDLTLLEMGAGSRFVVTNTAAGPCFADYVTLLDMKSSSRIVLPEDFSQIVGGVIVDSVPLPQGTYTGEGGTVGTVTNLIEGTGTLTIGNGMCFWSGAAQDGQWATDGNWSSGVPQSGRTAQVMMNGTYSINAPSALDIATLLMDVESGHATVASAAPLSISGTMFDVGRNSTLVFGSDTTYVSPTAVSADKKVVHVHDGGELKIGGSFVTSNLYGRICADTGGRLVFDNATVNAAPPAQKPYSAVIDVDGGVVAATNSTLVLGYNFNNSNDKGDVTVFRVGGGSTATFHNTHIRLDEWIWGVVFGTGDFTLSGNTHLDHHQYIRASLTAENPGEECRVRLIDSAKISGQQELAIGNSVANSRTHVILDSPSASIQGSAGLHIGCTKGYAEVEVKAGLLLGGGVYGTHIGSKNPESNTASTTDCFPTGVVKVTGGAFDPRGGAAGQSTLLGMIVGDGSVVSAVGAIESRFSGIVELSSGVVSNTSGCATFGLVHGYGKMYQTGGKFISVNTSRQAVIGMAGGVGEWIQTNGEATFVKDVYVGGATTAALGETKLTHAAYGTRHDAKGLIDVSGGTFTVSNRDIVLSADGEGTLAVSGQGSVSARNLVLSNTVDSANSVTYTSKLKFAADSEGRTGTLTLSGGLVVGDGASLTVDFSDYPGRRSRFRLLTAASITGSFAPGNVEILGVPYAELSQSATALDVMVIRSTLISIR